MVTITYGTIFELPTKPFGATLTPGSGRAETTGTQCVGRDLAHAGSRRTDERLFVNGMVRHGCMQPIFGKVGRCQEARI